MQSILVSNQYPLVISSPCHLIHLAQSTHQLTGLQYGLQLPGCNKKYCYFLLLFVLYVFIYIHTNRYTDNLT